MAKPRVVLNPRPVFFTLEATDYEALRRIAFEAKTSIANVVRRLVQAGIAAADSNHR